MLLRLVLASLIFTLLSISLLLLLLLLFAPEGCAPGTKCKCKCKSIFVAHNAPSCPRCATAGSSFSRRRRRRRQLTCCPLALHTNQTTNNKYHPVRIYSNARIHIIRLHLIPLPPFAPGWRKSLEEMRSLESVRMALVKSSLAQLSPVAPIPSLPPLSLPFHLSPPVLSFIGPPVMRFAH